MTIQDIDTRFATYNNEAMSNGNCFPLTGRPFGMNYFAMENQEGNWWFNPLNENYFGIRLTHQPSMWSGSTGDFCSLRILPFTSKNQNLKSYAYDKQKSQFNPAKLTIISENEALSTELIPSDYGALIILTSKNKVTGIRLSFPTSGDVRLTDEGILSGTSDQLAPKYIEKLQLYFAIDASSPIKSLVKDGDDYLIHFVPSEKITLRLGTSFISRELAKSNQPTEDEKTLFQETCDLWNDKLERIEVSQENRVDRSTFYHNLYRCFLFPQRCYERDSVQKPIHRDFYSGEVKTGYLFMNTGFWDTAKTLFPLLTLVDQPMFEEMLEGFYNVFLESGCLPKWLAPEEKGSMPGTLVDSVIADAAVKHIRDDLMPDFYQAMIKTAETQNDKLEYGRTYSNLYREFGYVPGDNEESVNHTLDYAYSDFCISQVAKALGDAKGESYFLKRSLNYQNLFDKKVGFMVAKDRDGTFSDESFSPFSWGGAYTEASAFQTTFSVFHDIAGLISCYESKEHFQKVITRLSNENTSYEVNTYQRVIHEMREMERNGFGQLNIGNQPSFHLPYLAAYIGKPYLYQPLLKQLKTQLFSDSTTGLPGDEDNGSMAAWYVFNTLGFYPFCPGSGEYVLGIPTFERATIKLSNGNQLTIKTNHSKPQYQFVDHVALNNQTYRHSYISHNLIAKGGILDFSLGIVPNEDCFDKTLPFSVTNTL